MSARKRRYRRESRRIERKRFRQAESAILRGDRARGQRFGNSWAGVPGMRANNLP